MKLNKPNLFISIWIIHLIVYCTSYNMILKLVSNDYTKLHYLSISFLIGLYGLFEQIPLFIIIPFMLMFFLIKIKFKKEWFISYVVAIVLSYLFNYLWIFSINKHNLPLYSPDKISLLLLITLSLMVSILCNWFIFKKQYKRLGV